MTIGGLQDNHGRNIELDFVRGLAILLVIGYHAELPTTSNAVFDAVQGALKTIGWSGVDLFFVLSGFLVGGVLLSEYRKTQKLDVKRFIIRRGLKIWPPYYFYILFQVVIHRHPIKSYLLANLLHIQNYVGSVLLHTWTLSLEEHFYLLLSFSVGWMVVRKWSPRRMIAAFLITSACVLVLRCITWILGFHNLALEATHARLDSLLFGVILTALFQFFPQRFEWIARHKFMLAAAAAASVAFVFAVRSRGVAAMATIGFTVVYLGYGAFMLLVYRHSQAFSHLLGYRLIARIGLYSYGIYLWHVSVREPCLNFANRLSPAFRWPAAMLLEYVAAIVLGAILTHLVEWPFLRLRDRLFPGKDRLASLIGTERPSQQPAELPEARPIPQPAVVEDAA